MIFKLVFSSNRKKITEIFFLSVDSERFLGCFKDETVRALSHYALDSLTDMSVKRCLLTCASQAYIFAGVQVRYQFLNCLTSDTHISKGNFRQLK